MTENPQDQPTDGGPPPDAAQPTPPDPAGQPPAYGAQGQQPAFGHPEQAPISPADARMYSLFAHLGGMFLSFLVPLVIYLVYKDRDAFIRGHSSQAMNFQIMIWIIYFVSIPLMFIGIGFLTFFAAAICSVVFTIMAAIAANDGRVYFYPLTPKMIT